MAQKFWQLKHVQFGMIMSEKISRIEVYTQENERNKERKTQQFSEQQIEIQFHWKA